MKLLVTYPAAFTSENASVPMKSFVETFQTSDNVAVHKVLWALP